MLRSVDWQSVIDGPDQPIGSVLNPLHAELIPIRHLLALAAASILSTLSG
jgi:hypothetical protein